MIFHKGSKSSKRETKPSGSKSSLFRKSPKIVSNHGKAVHENVPIFAKVVIGTVLKTQSKDFFLLLSVIIFMVIFGLVMVLSSSSIDSYLKQLGSLGAFLRQAFFAIVGIPLMLIVSRIHPRIFKKMAFPLLFVTCVLQLIVVLTPLGVEVGGNRNWLNIAGIQFQPSEGIKLSLVLWLGVIISRKKNVIGSFKSAIFPILLISGLAIGTVMLGGDLGTVMVISLMPLGALYFAGAKILHLLIPLAAGIPAAIVIAVSSPNRLRRVLVYLSDNCVDYHGSCWQIQHSNYALANGGIFGVGLGQSRSKWSWLPAAENDFIFSIVGEELGLIGALLVLVLFVVLAVAFLRILRGTSDIFSRATVGAIFLWIFGQAIINIGVVLSVFPTLGVPLPLISSGGSALLMTLIALGVVLALARHSDGVPDKIRKPRGALRQS